MKEGSIPSSIVLRVYDRIADYASRIFIGPHDIAERGSRRILVFGSNIKQTGERVDGKMYSILRGKERYRRSQ